VDSSTLGHFSFVSARRIGDLREGSNDAELSLSRFDQSGDPEQGVCSRVIRGAGSTYMLADAPQVEVRK